MNQFVKNHWKMWRNVLKEIVLKIWYPINRISVVIFENVIYLLVVAVIPAVVVVGAVDEDICDEDFVVGWDVAWEVVGNVGGGFINGCNHAGGVVEFMLSRRFNICKPSKQKVTKRVSVSISKPDASFSVTAKKTFKIGLQKFSKALCFFLSVLKAEAFYSTRTMFFD